MTDYFVFGSNKAGRHGKGAALHAKNNFGAVVGVGEGLTGTSYAIPTKGFSVEKLPLSDIDEAICRFISVAKSMPEDRFILTPVGTGLAGHSKKDIWSILARENLPPNVLLTSTWVSN